jgi:predicted PurR-regulated permease PerM
LEIIRRQAEKQFALTLNDPKPVDSVDRIWTTAADVAIVGVFLLLLIGALYLARPLLLPIFAAAVVGTTLGPVVKLGMRIGIPAWVSALFLTILLIACAALLVTLMASPVTEWLGRAPEIGANIRSKLYIFDRPLNALKELHDVLMPSSGNAVAVEGSQISMVTPVVAFVTPAIAELILFLTTLIFFLAIQGDVRRYMVSLFVDREAKLRVLRIVNDVEQNLGSYLAVVTVINLCLGAITAVGAWAFGLPNPVIFGLVAALMNYIPYIGPACVAVAMFGVGLVTFPTLGYALLPPACFVGLATLEGHLITPTILGRRLTLSPLMVVLALAFWTFLWGPMGAFLAVPISIIGLVVFHHLFPDDDPKLPG